MGLYLKGVFYSAVIDPMLSSLRRGGGDHYRNFRNYMRVGGMKHFATDAGLSIVYSDIRGKGVLKMGVFGGNVKT